MLGQLDIFFFENASLTFCHQNCGHNCSLLTRRCPARIITTQTFRGKASKICLFSTKPPLTIRVTVAYGNAFFFLNLYHGRGRSSFCQKNLFFYLGDVFRAFSKDAKCCAISIQKTFRAVSARFCVVCIKGYVN